MSKDAFKPGQIVKAKSNGFTYRVTGRGGRAPWNKRCVMWNVKSTSTHQPDSFSTDEIEPVSK